MGIGSPHGNRCPAVKEENVAYHRSMARGGVSGKTMEEGLDRRGTGEGDNVNPLLSPPLPSLP